CDGRLRMLPCSLVHLGNHALVVRSTNVDQLSFFKPLSIDEEPVGGDRRHGHLRHKEPPWSGWSIQNYRLLFQSLLYCVAWIFRFSSAKVGQRPFHHLGGALSPFVVACSSIAHEPLYSSCPWVSSKHRI